LPFLEVWIIIFGNFQKILGRFLQIWQLFENIFWANPVTLQAGISRKRAQTARKAQKTPKNHTYIYKSTWGAKLGSFCKILGSFSLKRPGHPAFCFAKRVTVNNFFTF
jgi:hypothetical protein